MREGEGAWVREEPGAEWVRRGDAEERAEEWRGEEAGRPREESGRAQEGCGRAQEGCGRWRALEEARGGGGVEEVGGGQRMWHSGAVAVPRR